MTITGMTNERELQINGATVQNVCDFLGVIIHNDLTKSFVRENEVAIYHDRLKVLSDAASRNGIVIKTDCFIEPKRPGRPAQLYPNLDFMAFKAVQISTNRVLLCGGYTNYDRAIEEFNKLWQILTATYSDPRPAESARPPTIDRQIGSPLNIVADKRAGTVTYILNEQGQTIIAGGAVNAGYKFEIGQDGVSIKSARPFFLDHRTDPFQTGPYQPEEKDKIIGVVGDTLSGLTRIPQSQSRQTEAERVIVKRRTGGRPHLADDMWAWEQVNSIGREPSEVYQEWLQREGVQARNLIDSQRQFKRITKPDWRN